MVLFALAVVFVVAAGTLAGVSVLSDSPSPSPASPSAPSTPDRPPALGGAAADTDEATDATLRAHERTAASDEAVEGPSSGGSGDAWVVLVALCDFHTLASSDVVSVDVDSDARVVSFVTTRSVDYVVVGVTDGETVDFEEFDLEYAENKHAGTLRVGEGVGVDRSTSSPCRRGDVGVNAAIS